MGVDVDDAGLLEREQELAVLGAVVSPGAPPGTMVLVEGGAGIGKTSIVRAACRMADDGGRRVLMASCAELERDFAFGVVRQLLAPVREEPSSDSPASSTDRPGGAGTGIGGEPGPASPFEVLEALYHRFADLASRRALLVVVDDVQWCDVASLRFLGFLVRRFAGLPMTLLVAGRPAEDDARQHLVADLDAADRTHWLRPRPLSPAGVGTLLRRELGTDQDERVVEACASTTEGNPLFVRELTRLLRERATDAALEDVAALGPQALSGHVQHRLARQEGPVRQVAYAVAVLGDGAPLPLVARVARLTDADAADAVRTLQRLGLVEWDRTVTYVHALIQDAVYASIDTEARLRLHERSAEELAADGASLERRAAHLMGAEPSGDQRRVRLLLATAEQSWQRGSPDSTIAYLRRALAEPPSPAMVSEVARRLGATEAYVLDFAPAEQHIRYAMTTADSPPQLALVGYSLARLLESFNEVPEATEVLLSVPRDPAAVGRTLAARIEAELVGYARIVLSQQAEYDGRLEQLRRFGAQDWHRVPSVVAAMTALGRAADGANATDVLAAAEPALVGGDLTAVMGGLYFLVHALLSVGQLEPARRELTRAVTEARKQGLSIAVAQASAHLAWEAYLRGDLREVAGWLAEGRSTPVVPGNAADELTAFSVELAIEQADLHAATAALDASGPRRPIVTTHCLKLQLARGRLALEAGNAAEAVAELRLLPAAYRRWDAMALLDRPWRLALARALVGTGTAGATAEARGLVEEQLTLAQAVGAPVLIGPALRAGARLRPAGRRLTTLTDAVDVLDGSPARLELAYARRDLAHALKERGRSADARQQARVALDLATDCGSTRLATDLTRTLSRGGGRPAPSARSGPAALTASERRVATLAAEGLTNRQIALRLFVTEKTVETHLGHVLRKLHAASRHDLPRLLRPEHG